MKNKTKSKKKQKTSYNLYEKFFCCRDYNTICLGLNVCVFPEVYITYWWVKLYAHLCVQVRPLTIKFHKIHSLIANPQGCCKQYSLRHGISNISHETPESLEQYIPRLF